MRFSLIRTYYYPYASRNQYIINIYQSIYRSNLSYSKIASKQLPIWLLVLINNLSQYNPPSVTTFFLCKRQSEACSRYETTVFVLKKIHTEISKIIQFNSICHPIFPYLYQRCLSTVTPVFSNFRFLGFFYLKKYTYTATFKVISIFRVSFSSYHLLAWTIMWIHCVRMMLHVALYDKLISVSHPSV